MPIRLGILGAGSRGTDTYGRWAVEHPEQAQVAAAADPVPHRLERLGDTAGIPAAHRFPHWSDLLESAGHLGLDAIVVALPDREHVPAALAAAEVGLPILLEKPAATRPGELEQLAEAARNLKARIWVSHVMRYQPFWQTIHRLVETGAIGRLITMRVEENIGFWHFAHSFVRGNWRNLADSSPMVLAKTCHDLDAIRWFAGAPPVSLTSVGELSHFRPENAPPGAPHHCLDGCPHEADCPFYAPRYYVDALADRTGHPVSVLGGDLSPEGRLSALREGPYGRCVYHCDNDVVDHQQTIMSFPDGMTATLSTSAFTGQNTRTVRLTGTAGEISGQVRTGMVEVDLFSPTTELPELPLARIVRLRSREPMEHRTIELHAGPVDAAGRPDDRGHSGGDDALIAAFVAALAGGEDPSTSLESSLDSHRMAFAAERSRLEGRTVDWEAMPWRAT